MGETEPEMGPTALWFTTARIEFHVSYIHNFFVVTYYSQSPKVTRPSGSVFSWKVDAGGEAEAN